VLQVQREVREEGFNSESPDCMSSALDHLFRPPSNSMVEDQFTAKHTTWLLFGQKIDLLVDRFVRERDVHSSIRTEHMPIILRCNCLAIRTAHT